MADVTTKQCNVCGKLRANDTNHWLAGRIFGGDSSIEVVALNNEKITFGHDDGVQHFCGENCATQWFATEVGKLR